MNYWLLLFIPLSSAAIGWITIRVVVRSLFRPLQPRKVLGMTWQGIFPRRQQQFAETIGKMVIEKFLSFGEIEEKFLKPSHLDKILPTIEAHIDDFLRNRLGKEMPMIAMFIGDKTIGKLKESFMKEIKLLFPVVMQQYAKNLKNEFDIEQLIIQKIAALSPAELEKMVFTGLARELRLARMAGATIGLLIGLAQVLIISLVS